MKLDNEDLIQLKWAYHVIGAEHMDSAALIRKRYGLLIRESAADKKTQDINNAYHLIRHAPLRYHISSHPKVQERYQHKTQRYAQGQARRAPPRPPRTFSLLGNTAEAIMNFIFGWCVGAIGLFFLLLGGQNSYFGGNLNTDDTVFGFDGKTLFLCVPLAIGFLAVLCRDKFWGGVGQLIGDGRWWW